MSFPRNATFIADWSPVCGISYLSFLQKKHDGAQLFYAVPEALLELIASEDQLATLGYTLTPEQNVPECCTLERDVSTLEQSVTLGALDIASPLRWSMSHLDIGMPRMSDASAQAASAGEPATPAPSPWASEQFIQAHSAYLKGHYKAALELVNQAIGSAEMYLGHAGDFRLPYLLGRIYIGSWFGSAPNAFADIIDTKKAETAFLDAARLLRQMGPAPENETDAAHCTLWAARAAYYHGDLSSAISHTAQALKKLTPDHGGLYIAARYQYAKMLVTRATKSDLAAAQESLHELVAGGSPLLIEAASDPQFIAHSELLRNALQAALDTAQKNYDITRKDLTTLISKLNNFRFAEISAKDMLHNEIHEIVQALREAERISGQNGLINLLEAHRKITAAQPKTGHLFSQFRSRFSEECSRLWENMPITRDAKSATEHFTACKERYQKAEGYYRRHGGFNRKGGQNKLAYAMIASLLTIYMLSAQSHMGGQGIVLALIFLIAAVWLYWAYFRGRLGLVNGYDAWRRAKAALENAEKQQNKKNSAAANAWNTFQRNIDDLGKLRAPF